MSRYVDPNRGRPAEEVRRPRYSETTVRLAQDAVERAISIESQHAKSYGGHRHRGGGRSPLLQLPLPRGMTTGRLA